MYVLDKDRARLKLLEEKKVPARQIDRFLDRYPPIQPSLGKYIDQWLDTGTVPEAVIDGIPLKDVIKFRRCHFLAAVRDLNQVLDMDLPPEKREQWRKILTTPVYYE